MTGKKKQGYTHFVGVLVGEALEETVADCRAWMADRYHCASGYRTPPHITVVPPFSLDEDTGEDLLETALGRWASRQTPFIGRVRGFGAFAHRTIFARVEEDPFWNVWHYGSIKAVSSVFPGLPSGRKKPFIPHLTVANRDIPEEAFGPALEYFHSLGLDESFPVDHLALFKWINGSWKIGSILNAGNGPADQE